MPFAAAAHYFEQKAAEIWPRSNQPIATKVNCPLEISAAALQQLIGADPKQARSRTPPFKHHLQVTSRAGPFTRFQSTDAL